MNYTDAACTIVSKNYIAYARSLCNSYLSHHPNNQFFVLLVDKNRGEIDPAEEKFELIEVDQLSIDNFQSIAFKYDILELNTNVKPTFLKFLFEQRKISKLIYFDPDIYIWSSASILYEKLDQYSILLTPHTIYPINDTCFPSEQLLLSVGVFNLGFIALSKSKEALRFLSWWEERCLYNAYNEPRSGLFVDQKWGNLIPCMFDSVLIFKHQGCNMAYWNLHERSLTKIGNEWKVNNGESLIFFHFSGLDLKNENIISKNTDRFSMTNRPDLKEIFKIYREELLRYEMIKCQKYQYAYGSFSNGKIINSVTRRIYSINLNSFKHDNPFNDKGIFYKWAMDHYLLGIDASANKYNSHTYVKDDFRIKLINGLLKSVLALFGVAKYSMLMKYLSYVTIFRNQKELFVVREKKENA